MCDTVYVCWVRVTALSSFHRGIEEVINYIKSKGFKFGLVGELLEDYHKY